MTQMQKLAWLNLVFLPVLFGAMALGEFGIIGHKVQFALIGLLMAGALAAMVQMARMPLHEGTIQDERDKQFGARAMSVAYLTLLSCQAVGGFAAVMMYPLGEIPLQFVAGMVGYGFVASIMAQSIAILVQYRLGRGAVAQ